MQSIALEDLGRRLDDHARWLASAGAEGHQLWLPGTDLSGLDLSGHDMTEAYLAGAVLDDARLVGTKLGGAFLTGASLTRVDFEGAHLAKATLDGVHANDARFVGVDLLRCTMLKADARGAAFDQSTLVRTLLDKADLRSCSLVRTHFDHVSIHDATFGNLDASDAHGTILRAEAFIETPEGIMKAAAEKIVAHFRRNGATDFSSVDPPSRAVSKD